MDNNMTVSLMDDDKFKELLRLMEAKGLVEETKQVMELAEHLDGMDSQMGEVLQELKAVRTQLGQLQARGIRPAAIRAVNKVTERVEAIRFQVQGVKDKFRDGVHRTLDNFKATGTLALSKTIDFLGIQHGLTRIHAQFRQVTVSLDTAIDRLSALADELHGAGTHMKNARHALAGRALVPRGERNVEKGLIFRVQKTLYRIRGSIQRSEQKTGRMINKLDRLSDRAASTKKASVKGDLKAIRDDRDTRESMGIKPELHQKAGLWGTDNTVGGRETNGPADISIHESQLLLPVLLPKAKTGGAER